MLNVVIVWNFNPLVMTFLASFVPSVFDGWAVYIYKTIMSFHANVNVKLF